LAFQKTKRSYILGWREYQRKSETPGGGIGGREGEKEVSIPTNGPNYDEMACFEILGESY
jgi:hypothetical protein